MLWYYQLSDCSRPDFWALGFSVDRPDFVNLHHRNARRQENLFTTSWRLTTCWNGLPWATGRGGGDARSLGVGEVGRQRFRPVVLGMASLPPLSLPLGSRPDEMLGRLCLGCVSPGLLVICGSPNSKLPPGLK